MSDFDEKIDEDDFIEEGEAGISYGDIRTKSLGPCLCLLMDFMVGSKSTCYLHHYNSEMTDPHVPPPQLPKSNDTVRIRIVLAPSYLAQKYGPYFLGIRRRIRYRITVPKITE